MWNSEPTSLGESGTNGAKRQDLSSNSAYHHDVSSVMSFASSSGGVPIDQVLCPSEQKWSTQQLEAKMDVVNSLLSMLGSQEHVDMGETLLALSSCPESCLAMRQSGCIPLLVQLVQSDKDSETRRKAAQALHNLVNSQTDEKIRKRETRILKLLEDVRRYMECIKYDLEYHLDSADSTQLQSGDKHPVQTVAHIMKLSFDEGHRQAICQLGGIHAIATLVQIEHSIHASSMREGHCILMRRYACMALTNLTFGDSGNKTLLCSFKEFMRALVMQLQSPSDELRQVTGSVLRNLSWRADSTSKEILRDVGCVSGLMKAAMLQNKENTLKSILSALWNLSAHCTENKSEICGVEGGLGFLVDMLTYKTPSKSLAIIENAGGILRNISSQIAVRDDYREILRKHKCLHILLDQLKSPSLTVVSNACGTLWNLSAKNAQDQEALWEMGAPTMLRSLNHSKHKMIAMGSSAALKNLLSCRPQQFLTQKLDSTAMALNLPQLPTLGARKQKALLQDLDTNLSETYENIDKDSPVKSNTENATNFFNSKSRNSPDGLTNAFASLNLNEPCTSYVTDLRFKSSIAQNYGGSSLPYVPQPIRHTNPASYLPVRTKYSDHSYEDDMPEQPIDYSRKYLETTGEIPRKMVASPEISGENKDSKYDIGYTETDLDQPTDYSLRYAEDDSDSDICDKMTKQEYVQPDTVKTYCTEGTPYETPFVFSNATSMSDLRNVGNEKSEIDNDALKNKETKDVKETKNIIDEKDRCSTEDISEMENVSRKPEKSQFSSGMMSPEKPVNYCEEGTPGYFSRVSSFGSGLDSLPANETVIKKVVECEAPPIPKGHREKGSGSKTPNEVKVVKFEQVVNYAEETPLMFSRSSSLASLDSVEQHSIHDDRSSIVSDFSRLTSGVVSPSELPDSPTQTVPSSPRPKQKVHDFPPSTSKQAGSSLRSKVPPKLSVFEDRVTKFKEESTPMQFSTATSLSSLTIDDHDGDDNRTEKTLEITNREKEVDEKKDSEKEKDLSGSDGSDDEDILAACISDGMQSNISIPTASSTPTKLPISTFKYQSGIPMIRRPLRFNHEASFAPKTYCTEDTPAELSRAGSNSNLSTLSIPNDNKSKLGGADTSSDDSSNLSADNENILEECIQLAMPKPKNVTAEHIEMPPPKSKQPLKTSKIDDRGKVIYSKEHRNNQQRESSLPPYLSIRDEVASYQVEDSPYPYSLRSSLSDLTVDGSVAGLKLFDPPKINHVHAGPSNVKKSTEMGNSNRPTQEAQQLNRRGSFSSLSSLASNEGDRALLEECIYSGMPTDKRDEELLNECIQAGMPSNRNDNPNHPLESAIRQAPNTLRSKDDVKLNQDVGKQSKNVNVASVAGSTAAARSPQTNMLRPEMSNTVAGVKESPARESSDSVSPDCCFVQDTTVEEAQKGSQGDAKIGTLSATNDILLLDRFSHSDENFLTDQTKSGSSKSVSQFLEGSFENDFTYSNSDNNLDNVFSKRCEESGILVDNRMLDPDAMIESLDRFTAELVSQASSHLNKDKSSHHDNKTKLSNNDDSTWNEDSGSHNDITFPSMSGSVPNVITFDEDVSQVDVVDGIDNQDEGIGNDFSSINTSTMTESTLIAIEASKMVDVLKKQEAEMVRSIVSDLDSMRPPSQLGSLTNSIEKPMVPRSPRLISRKKSLPGSLLVKRALSNSLNQSSSLESLENLNPPSEMLQLIDMDTSITSVASLPREKEMPHPIFNVKQQFGPSELSADLELVNPPSIFNDITDMCNSLADVASEAIGTETSLFEDCVTHLVDDTLAMDTAEFSDANSITPIQTDVSSAENTPKRSAKTLSKSMMTKQRRNMARDRYKTYVVAAEKVMQESLELETKEKDEDISLISENYKTANSLLDCSAHGPLTYIVTDEKLTPKDRRKLDNSRFETQIICESILTEAKSSPTRNKLSIRQNFMQKRLENKDRFKTQTLNESSFGSPELPSDSPSSDIHSLVEQEANLVLKTLRDSKLIHDELLDSETLSLVSNDEDSDKTFGSPINSRTYHRNAKKLKEVETPKNNDFENIMTSAKPKIVKPQEETIKLDEEAESPKAIRGRRKPLYSKTNIVNKVSAKTVKPAKSVAPSSLVKNVTATIKGTSLKNVANKPAPNTRPPVASQVKSSGYGYNKSPKHSAKSTPPLERQGTFTKDDSSSSSSPKQTQAKPAVPSKIPSFARQIARAVTSKIPTAAIAESRSNTTNKSLSADRTKNGAKIYNRSTSADSRESPKKIQSSSSTQSLKNESKGALKKSGIPSSAQRSNSNVSIGSNGSAKKQVTSKIASLWKKVEESKAKQQPVSDKRVWIQSEKDTPTLIRRGTFEQKAENGMIAGDEEF
ncbi:hypothetical protein ABEB36_012512 [Hypothenemus hampei]